MLAWEAFGALLVLYDLVTIPLIVSFNIPSSGLIDAMDWTTLVFWTLNIWPTCHTGFLEHGSIVMEHRSIIMHYMRTWMVIDLVVLVPDWLFTFIDALGPEGDGNNGHTGLKLLRVLRLFRLARLVRLMKLGGFFEKINDQIDSEYISICTNIAKMMLRLMTIWHIIACMFFAISINDWHGHPYGKWIDFYEVREKHWGYQYLTAYHWSIAQFTPAPSNVQPQNPSERIFAIGVLTFALLGFAYVVGSITGSLAQLRTMGERTAKMFWDLRRYLKKHQVPGVLSSRIQHYLSHAWASQQTEVFKETRIFQLLSDQLRSELQCELVERHLRIHPFFRGLSDISRMTMNRLASQAVRSKAVARGDSLFINGEKATHMYVVSSGVLQYFRIDARGKRRPERVEKGEDWIAEPVLWVENWEHLGCLAAETHCELCLVCPKEFSAAVSQNPVAYALSRTYARNFSRWLNDIPLEDHSDICQGEDVSDRHVGFLGSASMPASMTASFSVVSQL